MGHVVAQVPLVKVNTEVRTLIFHHWPTKSYCGLNLQWTEHESQLANDHLLRLSKTKGILFYAYLYKTLMMFISKNKYSGTFVCKVFEWLIWSQLRRSILDLALLFIFTFWPYFDFHTTKDILLLSQVLLITLLDVWHLSDMEREP